MTDKEFQKSLKLEQGSRPYCSKCPKHISLVNLGIYGCWAYGKREQEKYCKLASLAPEPAITTSNDVQ